MNQEADTQQIAGADQIMVVVKLYRDQFASIAAVYRQCQRRVCFSLVDAAAGGGGGSPLKVSAQTPDDASQLSSPVIARVRRCNVAARRLCMGYCTALLRQVILVPSCALSSALAGALNGNGKVRLALANT